MKGDPTKEGPQRDSRDLILQARIAWAKIQEDAPKRRALSRRPGLRVQQESQNAHRRWWLQVGQALIFGKRATKTGHAYYAWLKENGLEGVPRSARQDAIWLATNIKTLGELPDGLAAPGTIRQWAHKRAKGSSASEPKACHTQRMQRSASHVDGAPSPSESRDEPRQKAAVHLADMQRVADLLLEASMHLLHSIEVLRTVTQVVRRSSSSEH